MSNLNRVISFKFTHPFNQIVMMLGICIAFGVGVYFIYPTISPIFLASPYLNGFIVGIFGLGLISCFYQVLTMIKSVSWIESFALDRPGHEYIVAPTLLGSLAAMLSDRAARFSLTSTSTRSILDSVAIRLDEGREITRYIINLLIFLGLLGTFYGLAITVPAVVETIRSLAPQEGVETIQIFDNLMRGLESQLSGMGTAFGSSLLGLAGSLIVGLLDLLSAQTQGRFYRELEEWLSSITKITVFDKDKKGSETDAHDILLELAKQVATLSFAIEVMNKQSTDKGGSTLDEESRMRLRSMDSQLAGILQELSKSSPKG